MDSSEIMLFRREFIHESAFQRLFLISIIKFYISFKLFWSLQWVWIGKGVVGLAAKAWVARQDVCKINVNVSKLFKYFHVFAAMMMMIPVLEEGEERRKN